MPARYINSTYASEADLINIALFGTTAKEWRTENPSAKGNIRDSANIYQLIVLANLENLNSEYIKSGMPQADRLQRLREAAISQLSAITDTASGKRLKQKFTPKKYRKDDTK